MEPYQRHESANSFFVLFAEKEALGGQIQNFIAQDIVERNNILNLIKKSQVISKRIIKNYS